MHQFIVAGVGRSGTTALALALNLHPQIYCAIEQINHEHDHSGLLADPAALLNDEGRPCVHTRKNREFYAEKDLSQLTAIGNKWPNYHLRWEGVLNELSEPRAIVILRDLGRTIASWNAHVQSGFGPPELPGAYAAFDLPEMIKQATQSQFAPATLIVSYKALLHGERSAEVFAAVLAHLEVECTPAVKAAFLQQFADDPFIAMSRLPPDAYDKALADCVPVSDFIAEIDERGACRADQTATAASTLLNIEQNGAEITERFFACLEKSHPAAMLRPGLQRQILQRAYEPESMTRRIVGDPDAFIVRGRSDEIDVRDARSLNAGDVHYRAYVGPPERFDVLSISQVALLHKFGLREHHHVLDFGCGSLRLGRMLLPFLLPDRYFGIEPNGWLIEQGFHYETGQDIRALKRPRFSYDPAFDCCVFGRQFDYIIAQSIITHTGRSEAKTLFETASQALADGGVFLFSYIDDIARAPEPPTEGWVYPGCVSFLPSEIEAFCANAGLVWKNVDWPHPGARWAIAARAHKHLDPKPI